MSALPTPGSARAQAFHGELFGWQLQEVAEAAFALWRLPGHVGASRGSLPRDVVAVLAPTDEAGRVPAHWAVNFRVEDVDAVADRALELGGRS